MGRHEYSNNILQQRRKNSHNSHYSHNSYILNLRRPINSLQKSDLEQKIAKKLANNLRTQQIVSKIVKKQLSRIQKTEKSSLKTIEE